MLPSLTGDTKKAVTLMPEALEALSPPHSQLEFPLGHICSDATWGAHFLLPLFCFLYS